MSLVRHVLIAANPKSGAGSSRKAVQSLMGCLQSRSFQVQVIEDLDQLQSLAMQLHQQRSLAAVVSAGGDGTVAALANRLPADIPILVYPLGTENLLAKYWGLSTDIHRACLNLTAGRTTLMDVGMANDRLFLIMLGCGFDAEVVRRLHNSRTGHIRRWSYTIPICRSIAGYSFPQFDISGCMPNHHTFHRCAAWAFVFNVPKYAAGLDVCPQADPTDGRLDLCTFRQSGIRQGLEYLYRLWRNQHQQMEDYEHTTAQSVTIHSPMDERGNPLYVPYQIDGDPGGQLPVKIQIVPARLKLIISETTEASDPIPVAPLLVSST